MILLKEMRCTNSDFKNYLRMNGKVLEELLQLVVSVLQELDIYMRQSISAEERLIATLHFLVYNCHLLYLHSVLSFTLLNNLLYKMYNYFR